MTFSKVRRTAKVALNGRRVLVVEAARDDQLSTELAAAVAWAQVDEVRFMDALPVDKRHNAKIDYPTSAGGAEIAARRRPQAGKFLGIILWTSPRPRRATR